MVIIVTDEGRFWNHENPILERYADCVIVVCLNGKKVTDKYKCVVVPRPEATGLGLTDYSIMNHKFQSLQTVRAEMRHLYGYHEDVVFLADAEPQSLFPYLAFKDMTDNNLHLWCMTPWKFESTYRKQGYFNLLQDLNNLKSLCFIDSDIFLKGLSRETKIPELIKIAETQLSEWLPSALYEIDRNMDNSKKYYFDTHTGRYIDTHNSFDQVKKAKAVPKRKIEQFSPKMTMITMGLMYFVDYPNAEVDTKAAVEQLYPRVDEKRVCEELKRMRKELADANGIKYQPMDCPSVGPCAGTCIQCDTELAYLQKELAKIAKEDRVYPLFTVENATSLEPLKVTKEWPGDSPIMGSICYAEEDEDFE